MKVVVIGGTGLIGSKVVAKLNQHGHEAIAAAPNTGVNTLTGEGLAEVLTGAQVVVDVANSPSFEDGPAWDFFTTATGNVLDAAESAGVSHLVALSVVGTDRLLDSGYFRAKNAQEQLISEGAIPFSIVRATQFFEFVGRIADSATDGDTVRISSALSQPMAADDVATAVARTAVGQPVGGILEVAGPDRYPLDDVVRARLRAKNDTRRVVTDPQARYFGVVLDDHTLVPAHRDGVPHPLRGLAHRQRARAGPVARRRNASEGIDHDDDLVARHVRADMNLAARFAREAEPLFDVLSRRARRLTRSDADAEDLLQDTLLHAYAGFRTFQEGSNLQAWLFRILYNRWVSTYRVKQRRPSEVSVDG